MSKRFATLVTHGSDDEPLEPPVSSRPKVSVKPARIHTWNGDLATTVVRTIGFRWRCSCGEFGKVRSTPGVARGEGREHEAGHE